MIRVIESKEAIEIQSDMRPGLRILFGVLALFPLIAPYELIIRPNWQSYFNVSFLFVAAISFGALAVSAFLVWAAIAGLNSRLKFNRSDGILTYSAGAPIVPWRTVHYAIESLDRLQVEKHDWSEGSPGYSFVAIMADGKSFESESSWSREEIEAIVKRVSVFLGL
jgi:hypothetical protein